MSTNSPHQEISAHRSHRTLVHNIPLGSVFLLLSSARQPASKHVRVLQLADVVATLCDLSPGVIYLQNLNPPLFDTKAIRLFQVSFDDEVMENDAQPQQNENTQARDAAAEPAEEPNPAAAPDTQ